MASTFPLGRRLGSGPLLLAILPMLAAPAWAASPRSVAAGREIATNVCSACHQVADNQEFPPILTQPTPSFREVANRPGTTAASLRRFITTTHWDEKTIPMTMPSMMLLGEQADQVTAYILSLRTGSAAH